MSLKQQGYQENVSVDEGVHDDVHTQLHFQGDSLIVQKTFDAEPHLQYAAEARRQTDGQRWGDGRLVGHLPAAIYAKFLEIKDNKERAKMIRKWLQENTGFVMFDRFLK